MESTNLHRTYLAEAVFHDVSIDFSAEMAWQSPSNIALVKYWGKQGNQLPNNPSVSFTLKQSRTETKLSVKRTKKKMADFHFFFEGKEAVVFGQKIKTFLETITPYFPFLQQLDLHIESRNTFPHSSGIASSASSMSALVMCLLDLEQKIIGGSKIDRQKASFFSRLGSGSAARSVYPSAAEWGVSGVFAGSSDLFAVPLYQHIHPVFKRFHDSILIIHAGTKAVSSRAGHALMVNNPFAQIRYQEANKHTEQIMHALEAGDLETFIRVAENEALQLHALMMTSEPSFVLMQAGSIEAIQRIRSFRQNTAIPLCFTLDAGPNIHLLYPEEYREKVYEFIKNELVSLCHEKVWIDDQVGDGPSKIVWA